MIFAFLSNFFKNLGIPKSGIKREIYFLERAIKRDQYVLDGMHEDWPSGCCCPSCYYGHNYSYLIDKQERRHARLAQLKKKVLRQQNLDAMIACGCSKSGTACDYCIKLGAYDEDEED